MATGRRGVMWTGKAKKKAHAREPTWGRQIPITFDFENQRGLISGDNSWGLWNIKNQ